MKTKFGSWIFLSALILGITGCASKSVQKNFSLSGEKDEGMVVLSVSHDLSGGRGVKAIFYAESLATSGKERKMFFSLNDAFPGIAGGSEFEDSYGQLLVLALPVGKHEISSWQIRSASGISISSKEKPAPLVFEVRKGQVKYLGNLHGNVLTGKNLFGMTIPGNGFPEVRDQGKRDIPLFEKKYPQFAGKVTTELLPLGPWISSPETVRHINPPPLILPMPIRK